MPGAGSRSRRAVPFVTESVLRGIESAVLTARVHDTSSPDVERAAAWVQHVRERRVAVPA